MRVHMPVCVRVMYTHRCAHTHVDLEEQLAVPRDVAEWPGACV